MVCVLEFEGKQNVLLDLTEFLYNNNYHSSIQMDSFEDLYGRHYRFPIGWFESSKPRPRGINLLQDV